MPIGVNPPRDPSERPAPPARPPIPGHITISREQWQALCIERARMQRVVEAAREVRESCSAIGPNFECSMCDYHGPCTALRDLDALAGQDKEGKAPTLRVTCDGCPMLNILKNDVNPFLSEWACMKWKMLSPEPHHRDGVPCHIAEQDKGACPRCNGTGVPQPKPPARPTLSGPNMFKDGPSPYSPGCAPTRGHVVLDDDGEA